MANYVITSPAEFKVSNWSGGSTTELLIFPQTASLDKRDFDFRISSATVAVERSDFSDFSGYQRHIMSLTNPVTLKTGNNEPVALKAFETYSFSGSEPTSCVGSCTDFNLIHNYGYQGLLKAVYSEEKTIIQTENPDPTTETINFLYSLEDLSVVIEGNETPVPLKKNHLLALTGDLDSSEFRAKADCSQKESPIALLICLSPN